MVHINKMTDYRRVVFAVKVVCLIAMIIRIAGDSSRGSKHLHFPLTLSTNKTDLIRVLVNPFFGYFVCDYYIGTEISYFADIAIPTALKLSTPDDIQKMRAHETIYVQVNFLEDFIGKYLPKVNVSIFLFTGQWNLPFLTIDPTVDPRKALRRSQQITEVILNNSLIMHWFMQNPHIVHSKVTGIPYGVHFENLESYANVLRHSVSINKTLSFAPIYLSPTHSSRTPLIAAAKKKGNKHFVLDAKSYYTKIAESHFIFSPVGDRPECYRHWEAIGLGALPICNCPVTYETLFRGNMLFVSNSDYNHMIELSDTWAKSAYQVPNRRLVLVSYWAEIFEEVKRQCLH